MAKRLSELLEQSKRLEEKMKGEMQILSAADGAVQDQVKLLSQKVDLERRAAATEKAEKEAAMSRFESALVERDQHREATDKERAATVAALDAERDATKRMLETTKAEQEAAEAERDTTRAELESSVSA